MRTRIPCLLAALSLAASPAAASPQLEADTATVIVRLGVDTVAFEQWVHAADRLEAVSVYRTPRTTVRRYTVELDDAGRATRVAVQVGDRPAQEREVDPAGAIPVVGGFYAPFALAVAQAARAGADEVEVRYLLGDATSSVTVRRTAENVYTLPNQFGGMLEVRTDAAGRLLSVDAGGGTTVERTGRLDLDVLAREFAERDERGTGLGPLSPRESTDAVVQGASVTVEYGRPSARGRTVMGELVPYGEVWRTGANEMTHFSTDRAIEIGGVTLEPGTYSLLTIPERDAWTLIINSETGQSGLAHDPDRDVARVPMGRRELPDHVEQFTILVDETADGGLLRLQWERTEAYVAFRVAGAAGP